MNNRLLYNFGLFMAVLMILFTAYLLNERIKQIEAVRSGFWDNLAYTTSQTDFELVRLIDALNRAEVADPNIGADDIFIRFEVALSRLNGLIEGNTGQRILANETARDIVLVTRQTLENLEGEILAYSELRPQRQTQVKATLRAASADFHRATVAIASMGDRDQTAFYQSLSRAARFEIIMLGLILVAGAFAFANAFWERRRFAKLNQNLSDTVTDRTADLEQSNILLRSEIVERTRAEQRYRSLVEHATEAIVIFDVDADCFVEANPRAEALFGLPRKKLLGSYGVLDLSPQLQADGQPSDALAKAFISEALHGDYPSFEWVHQSVDGVKVPCQISLARFPDPDRRLVRGSIIDLTEQKKAEASQIQLERQLFQAQKLETIGQMTGGVAHDFNNLLSIIVGNLELLSDNTNNAEASEFIAAATDAAMKGANLTRSMLNFARRAHLQPETIALHDLISNMDNWISRTIPTNIRIERSLRSDLWPIEADVAGTESAFLNLVVNARDAMSDGGILVIETENVEFDIPSGPDTTDGLRPGRYVMLAVSDTGSGITPDVMAKVFDPFFSTKGAANNSGLGLSMVQGFMTQSGGNVQIYSEPSVGTTVKLFFPVKSSEAPPQTEAAPMEAAPRARILVAEDQLEVLSILKRSLEARGHEVIAAENGLLAVELFEKHEPIDLLITDIVMPGEIQGPALAKQLRNLKPNLPIIFMSGYASEATMHGNGLRDEDIRLMKPVSRKQLLEAVSIALSVSSVSTQSSSAANFKSN